VRVLSRQNSASMRFDGRVAVVTGAGNGLGRQYALELGRRGATVVVNDLGGSTDGSGASSEAADAVVSAIKAAGGNAVANYASVMDTAAVLDPVLNEFGKIDILINNAGILRDRSILRISPEDWQSILDIHLTAAFGLTQRAFETMKAQKYGKIIHTSSSSGIYGNFGQANYAAAKLGLVGLTQTVAIEGQKHNVHCNAIAPVAASRMTEALFPEDMLERLKPEFVAPMTLYLCHESCEETGATIEVGGGWAAKIRRESAAGALYAHKGAFPTVEDVAANFDKICDFSSDSEAIGSITEATMRIMTALTDMPEGPAAASTADDDEDEGGINPAKAQKWVSEPSEYEYTHNDTILYNLGIGAGPNKEPCELKYIYENHEDFMAVPSFAIVPAFRALGLGGIPGLEINLANILHGEQYIKIHKPFNPDGGKLSTTARIGDILDKGKHLVFATELETKDESGDVVCENQFVTFVRNTGGFGGTNDPKTIVQPIDAPAREPDFVTEEYVPEGQAALYRLNGDPNPLHLDPDFAAMAGFPVPILHGLCTYGYATRHIQNRFPEETITGVKGRFSSPVLPGQTLITKMWREGDKCLYEVWIKETNKKALTGGFVEFGAAEDTATTATPAGLQSDAVFEMMRSKLSPEIVASVKGVFKFEIKQDGKVSKTWVVDLKNGSGSVSEGDGKADTTISVADGDFADMAAGKLDSQKAFFSGKLKVKGNMMLTQKLGQILKP